MVWNEALPWMETFWAHSVESRSMPCSSKVQLAPRLESVWIIRLSQLDNESVPAGRFSSPEKKESPWQRVQADVRKADLNQSQVA